MEFLNDRIGILLKYRKTSTNLTKRFFFIDNSGNLNYIKDENLFNKIFESSSFNEKNYLQIISTQSKKINLMDCSISAIKPYTEDKFNLKSRSYFELFLKTRDYSTILIFSWKEVHITFLRDFFLTFSNISDMHALNDQFSKYDYENSPDYNISKNKENEPKNIFEFAENNRDENEYKSENILFEDLDNEKYSSDLKKGENLSTKFDNKNFSFKRESKIPIYSEYDTEQDKKEMSDLFSNKNNKINLDFKTGIDNLNNKLKADHTEKDEIKYLEEYNSNGEILLNKIYRLNEDDKKNVEKILKKLNGKYVNQIDWEKNCLKIFKPSQNDYEYDETWAQLENGSDYSGHVINLMPNGYGKEYRKDGIFYSGEFRNGKWHGQGVITNVNLDTFQGEFINGCICGI